MIVILLMPMSANGCILNKKYFFFYIYSQLQSDGVINNQIKSTKLATLATPENLLEKQIIQPHPRPTQLETFGMGPSNLFNKCFRGLSCLLV